MVALVENSKIGGMTVILRSVYQLKFYYSAVVMEKAFAEAIPLPIRNIVLYL